MQTYRKKSTKISRELFTIIAAFALFTCFTACNDELWEEPVLQKGEQPVQFIVSHPDDHLLTKAAAPKTFFEAGDVIHIAAEFVLKGGGDATGYGRLSYNGEEWRSAETDPAKWLRWPAEAESGKFTAYYIPPVKVGDTTFENKDDLQENAPVNYSYTDLIKECIEKGVDPLWAETENSVNVERAVQLTFKHIFTKLTFTHLGETPGETPGEKGDITTAIIAKGMRIYISSAVPSLLNNALSFKREPGKLTHDFVLNEDPQVVEPSRLITGVVEDPYSFQSEHWEDNVYSITYLLPPVEEGKILKLSFSDDHSTYHLVPLLKSLVAGKHYLVDVRSLLDNYKEKDIVEEEWRNKEEPILVDVGAYLSGVCHSEEYVQDGVQILAVREIGGEKVVTQLRDVDFNNQPIGDDPRTHEPYSIGPNIVFNANNHKIRNLLIGEHGSLFSTCPASSTIKNLTIEGVNVNEVKAENVGILAGTNNGTLENVNIVFIPSNSFNVLRGRRVGGLVGRNTGAISNSSISGAKIVMKIDALFSNDPTDNDIYIGGLVGYHSGNLIQNSNIQTMKGSQLSFTGTTEFVYIGGWAGRTEAGVKDCSSTINVNVIKDDNSVIHAGGFAGWAQNEPDGNTFVNGITSCTTNGTVTVPNAVVAPSSQEVTQKICAGGFAGWIQDGNINESWARGSVMSSPADYNHHYIGGFVGWITYKGNGHTLISDCHSTARVPDKDSCAGFIRWAGEASGEASVSARLMIENSSSKNNAEKFYLMPASYATFINCTHNGGNVN